MSFYEDYIAKILGNLTNISLHAVKIYLWNILQAMRLYSQAKVAGCSYAANVQMAERNVLFILGLPVNYGLDARSWVLINRVLDRLLR